MISEINGQVLKMQYLLYETVDETRAAPGYRTAINTLSGGAGSSFVTCLVRESRAARQPPQTLTHR
jgi:hypothetical protein